MKVLYDYQAFTMQKYGGVSRSFCEIISRLPADIQYEIALEESDNVHIREYGLKSEVKRSKHPFSSFLPKLNFHGKLRLYNFIESIGAFSSPNKLGMKKSVAELIKGDFDIFHPTFFNPYFLPYLNGKPFVLTVHDLIFEALDDKYHFKKRKQILQRKILCPVASHIIVPSQKTADDLMSFYKVPERKITVIYWGAPLYHQRRTLKNLINRKYILFTGERRMYKRWKYMISQISSIVKHYNLMIVCTGQPFSKDEISLLKDFGIYDNTINKFVSTEELSCLYNNAELFIYPSEYEGFGMPILEAMANGCPTLLSNSSCFPEIGGNASQYFDLNNENSLQHSVERIINDIPLKKEMIARGYERTEHFSWEKSAMQYANIYESLI